MSIRIHHIVLTAAIFAISACGEELEPDAGAPAAVADPTVAELAVVSDAVPAVVPSNSGLGAIEARLYPPALVLDHQAAIALTPEQRAAILAEVETTQTELVAMDADLRASLESLDTRLAAPTIDEAAALAEIETVMQHERSIKASHFRMLIRVRNRLTEEQRTLLNTMR